jgi:hypothetical protein
MTPDQAIEEIRAVRQQISEAYGHDVKAFLEHYRELERQYQERLIGQRDAEARFPEASAVEEQSGGAEPL